MKPNHPTTTIVYDDDSVRKFMIASIFWGLVGMSVGVLIALQLNYWQMNGKFLEWITFGWLKSEGVEFLTFGRLRPLHTNAAIFAFVGNMMFAGIYYSTQRLCRVRMAPTLLSKINFWGWQFIIVCAASPCPAGYTRGKEYAELIWPINISRRGHLGGLRGQLLLDHRRRNERSLYVAALVLHRDHRHHRHALHGQPPAIPTSLTHSYPIFGGRAGRAGAVVVWAQRRRLLPDHADPRHHVLLPAQGGRATGLLLPALHRALLVAGLHLHLGRVRTTCSTPRFPDWLQCWA